MGEQELSRQDIEDLENARTKPGFEKVQSAARLVLGFEDSDEYIWIDTCNIDKTSSSELSESINCMLRWSITERITDTGFSHV